MQITLKTLIVYVGKKDLCRNTNVLLLCLKFSLFFFLVTLRAKCSDVFA